MTQLTTKPPPAQATADRPADIRALLRRGCTTYTHELLSMTHEQFVDVVNTMGGTYKLPGRLTTPSMSLLVVGEKRWPLAPNGLMSDVLREFIIRKTRQRHQVTIVSERLFLEGLGLTDLAESTRRIYTVATMTELLGVTRNQIKAWVRAGLIEPERVENGVWYFDFSQVTAAQSIFVTLKEPRVTIACLRRHMARLARWMPEARRSLSQIAAVEANGDLLVRLADGDLAADDGQFHFDFEKPDADAPPLRIAAGPSTAAEWHAQGVEQERDGYLEEAVASYRDALLAGGPDVQMVFDLAHALHQLGRRAEAAERYSQAVEMVPAFVDAWVNLGVILTELNQPLEGCEAFRRALHADPRCAMAQYNLADTLTDLGRSDEAAPHWKAYLQSDTFSERAAYARRQLA